MDRAHDYPTGARIPGTNYVVVRPVGTGGMGQVYEVEDVHVGRRFVLKALHSDLRNRADLAERMKKEARALARLNHPNIVQVFTAGSTEDSLRLPFYVMERLDGQTLRKLIELKGTLGVPATLTIGIELLDALDRAHEFGIVHRDVKPENVFIHKNGDGTATTKLLDFGVIALLENQSQSAANRFIGTIRYAAPEQLRGEPVGPAADLYAAALTLYEMLTGRGPYDDVLEPGMLAHAHAHVHATPKPLSSLVSVPKELENVVMRALSKKPDDRPRDAFSFAGVLRNLKQKTSPRISEVPGSHDSSVTTSPGHEVYSVEIPRSANDLERAPSTERNLERADAPSGGPSGTLENADPPSDGFGATTPETGDRDVDASGERDGPSTEALGDARVAVPRALASRWGANDTPSVLSHTYDDGEPSGRRRRNPSWWSLARGPVSLVAAAVVATVLVVVVLRVSGFGGPGADRTNGAPTVETRNAETPSPSTPPTATPVVAPAISASSNPSSASAPVPTASASAASAATTTKGPARATPKVPLPSPPSTSTKRRLPGAGL
ncbi:MAG: protein kinase [Polyangiaceae bacterium]